MRSNLNTRRRDHVPAVLIVDDDEHTLATFVWMLRSEGYAVYSAANAELALFEAERRQPDAIILDLRMPHVDGVEFLRRLRARDAQRRIPVAVVTGDYGLDDSIAADLQSLGAVLQLKPLWFEDLLSLVQRMVSLRQAMVQEIERSGSASRV